MFPRSTAERLAEKRYVVSGDRAYLVGTADGSFPPLGWHIRGEMGGLWVPPIKLLDGYWLTLDGEPLPAASALHVHPGHVELEYPDVGLTRIEMAPDEVPAVVVGLALAGRGARIGATFRSKLLAPFPWTETKPVGSADLRGEDSGRVEGDTLVFEHGDWCALVRASAPPDSIAVAAVGDGSASGSFEWELRDTTTVWFAVAGSHRSREEAESALELALANPERLVTQKTAARRRLLRHARLIGADEELTDAFDIAKLNLADLRRVVPDVHVRDVSGGLLRAPLNGAIELRGLGAGYPDYAHFFGGDACYSAFGLAVSGQWETGLEHLCLLRDVSRAVNGATGKVVHEVTFDGSVCYGTNRDGGDIDETPLVAVATELLWRWSGDRRFLDELYDFVADGMRYVVDGLDADGDGYPSGEGGAERAGAGEETLAVCVWTRQGLRALERLARDLGDAETASWAVSRADRLEASFDRDWWLPDVELYADSLDADNRPVLQRHWVGALPMAAGIAPAAHAEAALRRLESPEFSGPTGLFHTGGEGGERRVWTVVNAVMAVAEARYGRLEQALRYMRPIADGIDLEMPGALPELLPSPDYDVFGDLHDRLMFMQAWSAYGVQWPIVDTFLGIRPDAPARTVSVTPNLPPGWPQLALRDLRVGDDTISVHVRGGRIDVTAPRGWDVQTATPAVGDLTRS